MPGRAIRRLALLAALGWAGFLYYLSDQPGLDVPPLFPMQDKVMHLVAYAVLGMLGMASRPLREHARQRAEYLRVCLAGGLYGVFDEFHQYFVPGRDADPFDVLADCCGVLLGAAVLLRLARLLQHRPVAS